jgi:hypothetical protein
MEKFLELWGKLDKDTVKLLIAFAAKALASGNPNEFIKAELTRIVVDPMPENRKVYETKGESR